MYSYTVVICYCNAEIVFVSEEKVPFRRTSVGKRSFSTATPPVWNYLPTYVLNCDSLTLFKARFRTHLFSSAFG